MTRSMLISNSDYVDDYVDDYSESYRRSRVARA